MQGTQPEIGIEGGGGNRGEARPLSRHHIPWRAKLRAFAAHLALSAAVFAAIIAVTVWLWYPPPFFWIDGALHVTLLAAAVDLVAGPLLTFVVYRPGKPRLVMNLAVIAAVQCAALGWGVQALYSQRPLLMAYVGHNQNRFYPVTEGQVRDGPQPVEALLALSPQRPAMVYVELPAERAEAQAILLNTQTSVLRQTERFRPVDAARLARIADASRTAATYREVTPEFARAIERFHAAHGEGFAIIPLYGRFGYALLAIPKDEARVAAVVAKEINLH